MANNRTTKNPALSTVSLHHKSRERVRDQGEVFTQQREVDAMLDLVSNLFKNIDAKFFEPAAGNGNFLVTILERKIASIDASRHGGTSHWFEFALLRCLASIYAVDIDQDNINEARERLFAVLDAAHVFKAEPRTDFFVTAATSILETNIVQGDSLNSAREILFYEYIPGAGETFSRVPSYLEQPDLDLFYEPPTPLPVVHYSEL